MLRGNWLSEYCTELERQSGVRISDYARQLILLTAAAAAFDPHPAWRRERASISTENIEQLIRQELEALVYQVRNGGGDMVTYFHVLHWFERSARLLSWPVPKDP